MERLGDLLKRLRRERRISQRQLADAAGFNSSVVNRAERGGDALFSTWDRLFRGLGHRLCFDTEELCEEASDVLAEEAERRRENRLLGLLGYGKNRT